MLLRSVAMRKTTVFRVFALTGVIVLAGAISASAQSISESGPGRISVEAEQVPLDTLLKELGEIATLEKVIIAPEVENRPVTLTISDVPIKDAIEKILEAADVNHAVWGGDGEPFRIYAGLAEDAVSTPPVPSKTEVPEPQGNTTIPPPTPGGQPATEADPEQPDPRTGPVGGHTPRPVPTYPTGLPDLIEPQPPEVPGQAPEVQPSLPKSSSWSRFATGGARLATGGAILATDGALLHNRPDKTQLALTVAILGLGLSMGIALVKRPATNSSRRGTYHRS